MQSELKDNARAIKPMGGLTLCVAVFLFDGLFDGLVRKVLPIIYVLSMAIIYGMQTLKKSR